MDGDLDDVVRRADPHRWLSSRFIVDAQARADVIALYAFDHQLARAGRVASSGLLAEIRLTWWREVLDEIFSGGRVRAHPTALALSDTVRRRGLPRDPLEAAVEARIALLEPRRLSAAELGPVSDAIGGALTTLVATVLDAKVRSDAVAPAGRAWGLVILSRLGLVPPQEARLPLAVAHARRAARGLSVAAFPAVAHLALARHVEAPVGVQIVDQRVRLLWTVATGRL